MSNEILFTTSDGVPIRMGDQYWYLSELGNKLYRVTVRSWQDHSPAKGYIQFGSEETAKKHVNAKNIV
jgi:hypothetical protein